MWNLETALARELSYERCSQCDSMHALHLIASRQHLKHLWAETDCLGEERAAEEELCTVAEERDGMGPALEEARWQARRSEREAAQSATAAAAAFQVTPTLFCLGLSHKCPLAQPSRS